MNAVDRDGENTCPPSTGLGHTARYNADSTIVQASGDILGGIHISPQPGADQVVPVSIAPPFGRRDPARPLRGRRQLLTELTALLDSVEQEETKCRVHVLHGLGGCGKTTIALDLAQRAIRRKTEVWWVSAVDLTSLTAGMHAIARRVGATEEALRHGDAADVLWRHLDIFSQRWLLIIDNADDPDLLSAETGRLLDGRGWVRPHSCTGLVVITSRDGNRTTWGPWSIRHPVGMLSPTDAALVLLDHTSNRAGSRNDAERLALRLNGLPLALQLAGAYLAETTLNPWHDTETITSFADYESALNAGRLDMFDHDEEATIARTWEISLDMLVRRGLHQARPLLRLLSCLADAPVAYGLLLQPSALAESPLFPDIDGATLWRLLCALADVELIDMNESRQQTSELATLRVHPLVRDVSRHHLGVIGHANAHLTLASLLLHKAANIETVGPPEWPPAWPTWQAFTSHALHVVRTVGTVSDVSLEVVKHSTGTAHLVARYLRARGQYDMAESEYREVLEIQTRVLGKEHPLTLATQHSIGGLFHDRGLSAQAEAEWRAVLDSRRRVLGSEHPDTLFTRHGLAIVLNDRGLTEEAEVEWQAVLDARRRVLGDEHPHTLATRQCLAGLLHRRSLYREADTEYQIVLGVQSKKLGANHPDTLSTRHRLATLLHDRKLYEAAEDEYRAVLTLRTKVLGENHPHTLSTRHRLATVLHDRKLYEAAEDEYRAVLTLRTKVLGENHPHTLLTRRCLAMSLQAENRMDDARNEYRTLLEIQTSALGVDHEDTDATRRELQELNFSDHSEDC
ncbi:MAG TPA: tetratricopeptide repeat protein [Spirillospora sp.]|nr:tetratricopeptide repeat protein [Spirillospora sp.]